MSNSRNRKSKVGKVRQQPQVQQQQQEQVSPFAALINTNTQYMQALGHMLIDLDQRLRAIERFIESATADPDPESNSTEPT